jgi:hypothetical protein
MVKWPDIAAFCVVEFLLEIRKQCARAALATLQPGRAVWSLNCCCRFDDNHGEM